MKGTLLLITSLTANLASASAEIVAQWNFNNPVPDASVSTGTAVPSLGRGTASLVGGTTATFATGDTAPGHDPAGSSDNSGWQTTGYPAASANNLSAGVRFDVDTTGHENIPARIASFGFRQDNDLGATLLVDNLRVGFSFADALGNPGATSISLHAQLSGQSIILTWIDPSFGLQSAPEASGPYSDIPDATSPYTHSLTGSTGFFRLRRLP